jgi:hypothetical protein
MMHVPSNVNLVKAIASLHRYHAYIFLEVCLLSNPYTVGIKPETRAPNPNYPDPNPNDPKPQKTGAKSGGKYRNPN